MKFLILIAFFTIAEASAIYHRLFPKRRPNTIIELFDAEIKKVEEETREKKAIFEATIKTKIVQEIANCNLQNSQFKEIASNEEYSYEVEKMSTNSWRNPNCIDPREDINIFIKENPIRTKTFKSPGFFMRFFNPPTIEDKQKELIETLKFRDDVVKIRNFAWQEEVKLEYTAHKYIELIKKKQKV
jgi:hypothetical protein